MHLKIPAHRKVKVIKSVGGSQRKHIVGAEKKQPVVKNKQSSIPVTPNSVGLLEEAWPLPDPDLSPERGPGFSGCEVG